jgi:hypothetical protein
MTLLQLVVMLIPWAHGYIDDTVLCQSYHATTLCRHVFLLVWVGGRVRVRECECARVGGPGLCCRDGCAVVMFGIARHCCSQAHRAYERP